MHQRQRGASDASRATWAVSSLTGTGRVSVSVRVMAPDPSHARRTVRTEGRWFDTAGRGFSFVK